MKLFSKHLKFEILVDLAEGRLADSLLAKTELHLQDCDYCKTEFVSAKRLVNALRNDELKAAPPFAIARTLQLFNPLARALAVDKPPRRSLWGNLHFDSGTSPMPAFGLRSGAHSAQNAARQLFFNVDEFDIDIRIQPNGSEWSVAGQLLGSSSNGEVDLVGFEHRYASELNELGEFSFTAIPGGDYQMLISLSDVVKGDVDISIPALKLGE